YKDASAPAARFLEGVDFAGVRPVAATAGDSVSGAALGNEGVVLGWFRDAECVPPDWPVGRVEGEVVALSMRGSAPEWQVQFHDTSSGDVVARRTVRGKGSEVSVPLPAFEESIAFKMLAGSSPGQE
ncbi:MAG: hypothetical protein ACE5JM_13050, partial [Armatimonadota bacterium]